MTYKQAVCEAQERANTEKREIVVWSRNGGYLTALGDEPLEESQEYLCSFYPVELAHACRQCKHRKHMGPCSNEGICWCDHFSAE